MKTHQKGFIGPIFVAAKGFLGPVLSTFNAVLNLVPAFIWAGIVAALLVGSCMQSKALKTEKGKHSATKLEYSEHRSAVERQESVRAQTALAEASKQREIEQFRNTQAMEADNALRTEIQSTRAALATRRSARVFDKAVDQFAANRPTGGAVSGDPKAVARADEKTAAIGSLLKTCRAEGASDAGDLEELAAQLRGLQARYLSLLSQPLADPPSTP